MGCRLCTKQRGHHSVAFAVETHDLLRNYTSTPWFLSSSCKACLGLRKATYWECARNKSKCEHQLAATQPFIFFILFFGFFLKGVQCEQRPQEFDIQVSPVEDSPNACQLRVWLGTESCKSSGQCVPLLIHQLFAKRGETQKRWHMMDVYRMSYENNATQSCKSPHVTLAKLLCFSCC